VYIAFLCYGDGTGAGDPTSGSFSFNVLVARPYCSAQKVCSEVYVFITGNPVY